MILNVAEIWLRRYATGRKVVDWILDEVLELL
jgi:hypothetical protein